MQNGKTDMKFTKDMRKDWKRKAKHVLKTHYILLVMVALLAGMMGVEGGYILNKTDLSGAKTVTVTDIKKAGKATEKLKAVARDKTDEVNKTVEKVKNVRETGKIITDDENASAIERVITAILEGNMSGAEQISEDEMNSLQNESVSKSVKGHRKGALAAVVNSFASGNIIVKIVSAVGSMLRNPRLGAVLVILLVMICYFLIWFFIANTYKVMMARVYMESAVYPVVPIGHLVFLKAVRKWNSVSKAMFRYWIYKMLWWLTIVGGLIKHYSYWCVPYILAENPAMTGKEAIELSRRMMNGRKWETFKYDCTFIGWYISAAITVGLLNILFVTPYKRSCDVEAYTYIRERCQIEHVEGINQLKDIFLFEKTDPEVLAIKYADILIRKHDAEKAEVKLTGAAYVCAKYFGLWIGSREDQLRYEAVEVEEVNLKRAERCAHGLAYPERYNPLWNETAEKLVASKNNYLKNYSIWSIIAMFAIFAFVGWAWEVGIHIVEDGVFINRGVNHGPWLPIYGAGACMILLLLKRFRENPAALGGAAIVLCGFVEYMTSWVLEMTKGIRWWDYTGYFLNLNGRICAEGLLVFAVAGMAAVYVLAPAIDRRLMKINHKALVAFCIVFLITFTADTVYSGFYPNAGEGITDYNAYQEAEQIE